MTVITHTCLYVQINYHARTNVKYSRVSYLLPCIHFRYTLCYHSFACRYKIFTMYVPGKYTHCKIKCYPVGFIGLNIKNTKEKKKCKSWKPLMDFVLKATLLISLGFSGNLSSSSICHLMFVFPMKQWYNHKMIYCIMMKMYSKINDTILLKGRRKHVPLLFCYWELLLLINKPQLHDCSNNLLMCLYIYLYILYYGTWVWPALMPTQINIPPIYFFFQLVHFNAGVCLGFPLCFSAVI